ncbi:unnamed protein product, partial [Pelagomonas calceolata]
RSLISYELTTKEEWPVLLERSIARWRLGRARSSKLYIFPSAKPNSTHSFGSLLSIQARRTASK